MATMAKEPIQVYLPTEQVDALQALAQERGVTLDALIEQSVDALLATTADVVNETEAAAGWPEDRPIEEHPLWAIVGLGASDVTDLAENHDKYLVEFEEANNRSWPDTFSSANSR